MGRQVIPFEWSVALHKGRQVIEWCVALHKGRQVIEWSVALHMGRQVIEWSVANMVLLHYIWGDK